MMIMKKIFNSIFVIIAAMVAFAGCAKENAIAPGETRSVQFFAESIETKTHFGDKAENNKYPTFWDAGDKVKVLLNLEQPNSVKNLEATVEVEASEDSKSARFNAEINSEYAFDAYTFYAVSPSSAYNAKSSTEGRFTVQIPNDQTPQAASVDKAAHVLYSISATTDKFPSSVKLNFKHFTAYGKFSLSNLTDKVSSISSIKLSFEEDVVGKWNYFVADGTVAAKEATNDIVLNTTSTEDIWFACAPVDMSEKTLTMTVVTDKGNLVKEITFPANRKFESGKIANFIVDMKGIEVTETEEPEQPEETTKVWTLVTDVLDIAVGDEIIIAAKEYNYAIGAASSNGNNRTQVAITKSDNKLTSVDGATVLTLQPGTTSGSYSLFTGSKYLYAASSSSNYLKEKDDKDANGSWKITISDDGTASIVAQGTYTRNTMQYNQSSGLFACYGSASQKALAIYKQISSGGEGGETPDTTPSVKLETEKLELNAEESEGTIKVEVKNIASIEVRALDEEGGQDDSDWLVAEYDEANACITYCVPANESEEPRTAYIEVYCLDAAGNEIVDFVNVTQKGIATEPAGPQVVTVAEFLAATVNETVLYQLTGTIKNIADATWGNFTIEDATASVYIYGLTKEQTSSNDKSFASIGLRVGDEVTLITVRGEYKGEAQGGGNTSPAYYVSHVAAPYFELKETTGSVAYDATTFTVHFESNLSWTATPSTGVSLNATSGNGNGSVEVTFAANETEENRKHTVTFTAGDITEVFTLTQTAKPAEGSDTPAEPVTATLSFADKAQRTTFDSSKQIWEQNGIKLINNKASSTNAVADYAKPARFYAGSDLNVTAPGAISMIVFDTNSSSYATAMKNSIGTVSDASVTVSSDKVTVTFSTPVASFAVAKFTAQVRMDSMDVTYIPAN